MNFIEVEKRAGLALALLILAASLYLMAPFFVPMFWAALMVLTTWPVMSWLNNRTHRPLLNAGILSTLWLVLVLAPLIALVAIMAVEAKTVTTFVTHYTSTPLPDLPTWVGNLPAVGGSAQKTWADLQAQGGGWFEQFKPLVSKSLHFAMSHGGNVAHVLMHVLITLFFVFMFYWQGSQVAQIGHLALGRLVGSGSRRYIEIVTSTLKNVINGIVGTALAQAVLSIIGFWIAGVPGAVLLGVATFFLSLIPMGAPLVWLPAVGWLFYQGESGWAIFVAVWCLVVIGGVDHVLKPLLISRGSVLPLSLVLLAVFGGILNFGFLGIFIGPAILALGYSLVKVWLEKDQAVEPKKETPGPVLA
jgi:predicted PurR-regulated permease PerM